MQPVAGRRKRLLVADMDSTMIGQECIDELADELGLKARIAAITERAMRGEIAFEPALRERVGCCGPAGRGGGQGAGRAHRADAGRARTHRHHAGGRRLIALVSGGFTLFTGPVAARIGFDENRANVLVVEDGLLAGRVEEPISAPRPSSPR